MEETNSMTIQFSVNNQTLTKTSTEKIVEYSVNYLYAQFTFNANWDNTTKKYVILKNNDSIFKVEIDNENKALIPSTLVLYNSFALAVIGVDEHDYVVITTNPIYVPVYKTLVPYAEDPFLKFVESTDDSINVTQSGDRVDLSIPNIYFKDAELTNNILNFFGRNNTLLKSLNIPYGLVNDITLEVDNTTYTLTLKGYDRANNLLFTRTADLNIETKVFKTIYYDAQTEELVFVTMDDEQIRVPIGDILTGIATQDWVNANFYTKAQADNLLATKQATLVNQQNIKSINGVSLLGSGDLDAKNLGYVFLNVEEIEEDDMFTLSDSQIAELQKDYSIIFVDNEYYKKEYNSSSDNKLIFLYDIYFATLLNSGIREAHAKYIEVDLTTKKAILHDEEMFTFYEKSKADELLNGKQNTIDSNNKLSSDLVNDANATNKFVSASEKAQITTNANAISNIKDGQSIDSFGDVETALNGKQGTLTDSTSIDLTSNVVSVKQSYIDSQFATTEELNEIIEEVYGSEYRI